MRPCVVPGLAQIGEAVRRASREDLCHTRCTDSAVHREEVHGVGIVDCVGGLGKTISGTVGWRRLSSAAMRAIRGSACASSETGEMKSPIASKTCATHGRRCEKL